MLRLPATLAPWFPAAGLALGLLLAVLLWVRPGGNRRANGWLAVAVGAAALVGLDRFTSWLLLVIGPCVWLYTCRLTRVDGPYGKRLAVHFFPAAALLLALLPFYLRGSPGRVETLPMVAAVQLAFYGWLSLLRLKRHASAAGPAVFRAVRITLAVGLTFGALWVLATAFALEAASSTLALALPLALYVLGLIALLQPAED
jgi:hypothetical protein